MRQLVYYIAATVDGYIAGPNGQFDFFSHIADPQAGLKYLDSDTCPTHVRQALNRDEVPNERFDTVLMGRHTYEVGYREGISSPYAHLRQFVFSSTLGEVDPAVTVVDRDPVETVRRLKSEDGLDIWLCGGGNLAGELLGEIDRLEIKRDSIVAGSGIPMFAGGFAPTPFRRTGTHQRGQVTVEVWERC
ncbi:dihydrofolate reductase family protein [Natronoglycomyces albus]|uniref:Dihydrofolate reductase family protein n=1 Tax=Natronoglycomyces albus TaxID=2811108 RepID=A0A895XPS2_9ACTN|nr:dihydrofolate reductase family protein [Natronoglycomyces albus]QSB05105.1 dihydrofolate reductase family protein [Natronoglycomyces albus]